MFLLRLFVLVNPFIVLGHVSFRAHMHPLIIQGELLHKRNRVAWVATIGRKCVGQVYLREVIVVVVHLSCFCVVFCDFGGPRWPGQCVIEMYCQSYGLLHQPIL